MCLEKEAQIVGKWIYLPCYNKKNSVKSCTQYWRKQQKDLVIIKDRLPRGSRL